MKFTKQQIKKLRGKWEKAHHYHMRAEFETNALCGLITEITGIEGHVDFLAGDGLGFTPESNNDVHIPIGSLLNLAEKGIDINEDVILKNLTI